jgi:hypothetical protein
MAMCKSAGPHSPSNAIVDNLLTVMEEALTKGELDTAKQLGAAATDLARRSKDPTFIKETVVRQKAIAKELVEVKKAQAEVEGAADMLEKNPTDAAANSIAGRYRCFIEGKWDQGIPMLALGDDPALKDLAVKELKGVTDATQQANLADGWWDLGEKKVDLMRKNLRGHAAYWYQQALPGLTGLVKEKVEKRLTSPAAATPLPNKPR